MFSKLLKKEEARSKKRCDSVSAINARECAPTEEGRKNGWGLKPQPIVNTV
ncbi:MAG: hypothetical protein F6K35_18995 [Okeania sp. SIO2H7]|nr:hypothetical protein [Okeania sp. SIO2H7]